MDIVLRRVETPDDQVQLARLAAAIWGEYWPAHIGQAQTDYMVEHFQSVEAIRRDMAEHAYEYWFVCADDGSAASDAHDAVPSAGESFGGNRSIIGYTGGRVESETDRFFISKIYLLAEARGKHACSRIIDFYGALCSERGLEAMYLTVNKGNELAIRAYKGNGFRTIDAVETSIGEGFIMDDYIMQKDVVAS